ncbi:crotonase/enoyl-CoA hydratase family protein [Bordetella bronchiseptica]|uniref:crotonase/enoyl-CoA hydratase family protein n=1 Tax=Bordetella bronchiseptica TaxID=518 RepID=UPI00028BC2E3|nr:crotonase/enoyl-CoA hydratase family protein [Bordetella bronchiseptica]KCV26823.1 enoyl-CoA hydratase/isomerase family protein [Bordetella bronchiseptica 00-P-2730]KDD50874.1 enoyl-CoA hydratase/isomerase family protein [Bordetella bronchiseptica OSU553]AUL14038.1 enoyl-CoA hydratase [Bordetella bronchiseptica]AWP57129.1 enoyl-CoA hydratase [Bordetella bronchiseptica]AWQ03898.1 enoyl-CoA hydratase [Bordetella bronchiseptica]
MSKFLRHDRDGAIWTVTLDQPETRNALTGNTAVQEIVDLCEEVARDDSVRVIILTGADPVFSSGGNVKDMRRFFDDSISAADIRQEYRHGIQRLTRALYNIDVPTIAAVNGAAIGAGCDLACMCDIRIASEQASFAESFIKVGIVPGDGGAWLLPRVVGMSRALEMSFTGDAMAAAEALACGLVSRVVPHDQLLAQARQLAERIAANPGATLRLTKRLLREGQELGLDSLLEQSASAQAIAHKTPEHREAVTAFIEKRRPDFSRAPRRD